MKPRTPSPGSLDLAALRAIIASYDYPWSHFSIESFLAWLSARTGRELRLLPAPSPPHLFGAWMGTEQAEYFFYNERLQGLHRLQVILHEVAHWLLLHPTRRLTPEELCHAASGRTLDLAAGCSVQQRAAAGPCWQDQEAERLASLILEQIARHAPSHVVSPTLAPYRDDW